MVMAERPANHGRHPPSKLVAILAATRRLSVTTVTCEECWVFAPPAGKSTYVGMDKEYPSLRGTQEYSGSANPTFYVGTPNESWSKTVTPLPGISTRKIAIESARRVSPIVRDQRLCGLVGAVADSTGRAKPGLRAPNPAQPCILREVHAAEEGLEAGDLVLEGI